MNRDQFQANKSGRELFENASKSFEGPLGTSRSLGMVWGRIARMSLDIVVTKIASVLLTVALITWRGYFRLMVWVRRRSE